MDRGRRETEQALNLGGQTGVGGSIGQKGREERVERRAASCLEITEKNEN